MSAISRGQRIIAPLIIASRLIFSLSVIDQPEWASTVDPRIVGASTRAARRDGGERTLISACSVVRDDQPVVRRRTLIAGGALSAAAFLALLLGQADAAPPNTTSLHHDFQPVRIAMPEFSPLQPADRELAHDTTQIITANLKGSGVFAPIDQQTYVEKDIAFDSVPRWPDWRMINAQTLVTGRAMAASTRASDCGTYRPACNSTARRTTPRRTIGDASPISFQTPSTRAQLA